jgi:phage-related protein
MDSLPTLIENIPLIIDSIAEAINENAPKLLIGGANMIFIIAKGLLEAVPALLSNLDVILKTIIDVIFAINWLNFGKDIITFIGDGFKQLASHLPQATSDIFESVKNVIVNTNWIELGRNVILKLGQGLKALATNLPEIIKSIFTSAVNAITSINWVNIGTNVIKGIVNGLKSAGGQIKEFLLSLMKGAVDSVKKFFGIHSPSRLMRDEIGKFIPMGMALGIDDESDKVTDAMEELQQIPEQTSVDLGSVDVNGNPINVSKQLVTSDLIKQQDTNNTDVISRLEQLINLLSEYLPQVLNTSVVLDTGALVGQIAPDMDVELGRLADKNLRGVY